MDPVIFFGVLTTVYGVIFFFDRFFKSCMHYPYDAFLKNTGLTVQFLSLRWHTTAFNRAVLRLGNSGGSCSRSWLTKSFTAGVLLALSLLPVGIILLFITIFSGAGGTEVSKGDGAFKTQPIKVEILLPGVNLPLEEICYYVSTLLLSTVVHELGHAVAAVLEDIPVTGFGFHLYFCIPLAYTEISAEHLNSLKWFRKLRILCGGIWHNFIFAGFCYLLLSTLGFIAAPLYSLNKSVIVTEVTANSPLKAKGERGLVAGNVITQINECFVLDEDTWYACLLKALRAKPGFCVSSDFIRLNDESIEISHHGPDGSLQCCDDKNEKLCCFEYIDDFSNDAPVEIPQHVCLDVRRTIEEAHSYCTAGGNCEQGFCLRPLFRNTTTILSFKRETTSHAPLRDVIYIGHPADVMRTIRISSFVPKQKFASPQWGDAYTLFLKYNIVFSIGLALINAIPCFGLDGHHIASTIINSFLVNRIAERSKREVVSLIVSGLGTVLFCLAVLKNSFLKCRWLVGAQADRWAGENAATQLSIRPTRAPLRAMSRERKPLAVKERRSTTFGTATERWKHSLVRRGRVRTCARASIRATQKARYRRERIKEKQRRRRRRELLAIAISDIRTNGLIGERSERKKTVKSNQRKFCEEKNVHQDVRS